MIDVLKAAVVTLWFFYLAWGPALTVMAIFASVFGSPPLRIRPVRYFLVSVLMTLLIAPVFAEGGIMTWWMVPIITDGIREAYIWQYAIACLAAQFLLGLLGLAIRAVWDHFRFRADEGR